MWILKLDGGLLGNRALPAWLDVVARNGDGQVVLVPEGGVLADAVSLVQAHYQLEKTAVSRMTVLAMDQFGLLMQGLNPLLVTAKTQLELAERGWQHRGIIWLPSQMVIAHDDVFSDFVVTADALAAWLAGQHEAKHVIILKPNAVAGIQVKVDDLISEGIVDIGLKQFMCDHVNTNSFKTWILGYQQYELFNQAFDAGILSQNATEVLI